MKIRLSPDGIGLGLLAALALAICLPFLFSSATGTGEADWAQVAAIHCLQRDSLLREGRFPLWTDFLGGGYPIFAHPESAAADPLFYACLPLEIWFSLKIRVLIYYLLAATGTFLLARRRLRQPAPGAFLAGALFAFGSYFPYHFATGNLYIGCYALLPWLLLSLSGEGKFFRPAAVGLLGWLLLGPTGLWMGAMLLFLAAWSLLGYLGPARNFQRIRFPALAAAGLAALLLAGVRIVPLAQLLQRAPRDFGEYREAARGSLTPGGLVRSLADPGPFLQGRSAEPGERPGLSRDEPFADSTVWIGPLGLLLAGIGLAGGIRKNWRLVGLFSLFALLTMGAGSPLDLYFHLNRLPLWKAMHLPNKYFAPLLQFILALGAGSAGEFFRGGRRKKLFPILAGAAVLSLLPLAWFYHSRTFSSPPRPDPGPSAGFRGQILSFWELDPLPPGLEPKRLPLLIPGALGKENLSFRRLLLPGPGGKDRPIAAVINRYEPELLSLTRAGFGVINWYGWLYLGEFAHPRYLLEMGRVDAGTLPPRFIPGRGELLPAPGYRGEAWAEKSSTPVEIRERRSGKLTFKPPADGAAAVFNLNWYPGWRTPSGEVLSREGLLAWKGEPGPAAGELYFLPGSWAAGTAISALAAFGIAGAVIAGRKRKPS